MAVMTIYNPLVYAGGVGTVVYADSLRITIVSGSVTQSYYSAGGYGFTYSGATVTSGTVTSTNFHDANNGGWQYDITGLFHDAAAVAFYVSLGFTDELRAFFLNGNDTINGSWGADILYGYGGTNVVYGNGGNDTIYGGNGVDSLIGGAGDDSYVISGTGAVNIIEGSGNGNDSVTIFLGNFSLPDHFETLLLQSSAENGSGNSLDNLITGNGLANLLNGGAGNDTLQGGWDNDTLDGGSGNDVLQGGEFNDTYIVDSLSDVVSDSSGIDVVIANVSGYTLAADIESLLLGASIVAGVGNSAANELRGNTLANHLDGAGGNDSIFGESGSDTLLGGEGNDTLDGGTDADSLVGGGGNDIYLIDGSDVLVEGEGGGIDDVLSAGSFTLAAEIENLTLTGGASINGTGNALANVIFGNDAANILDGGAGADTLYGGLGDDTYHVDNAGDMIIDSGGLDTLLLTNTYSLASATSIENVTLTGTDNINVTGNALVNIITGNSGNNQLVAVGTGDRLYGNQGSDTLIGSDRVLSVGGEDTLDGGAGADLMVGGSGADTYYVDDPGDVIIDTTDYGSSLDIVFSSVSYVLPQYADRLTLTGSSAINASGSGVLTGNSAGNMLTGGAADNDQLYGMDGNDTLDGGGGVDKMYGGLGNDLYFADFEGPYYSFGGSLGWMIEDINQGNDTVISSIWSSSTLPDEFECLVITSGANATGNGIANLIIGNAAANIIDGKGGIDTMIGGGGDDQYRVDNSGDVIVELENEGIDRVVSSVNFSLVGLGVEDLWLNLDNTTANLTGTGNELNNSIRGGMGENYLSGGLGNDTLDGNSASLDTLVGGVGDDVYIIMSNPDVITEYDGEGIDTVETSINFSLAAFSFVENLQNIGSFANLTGNSRDNVITGGHITYGEDGNDSLTGSNFNGAEIYGGNGNDYLYAGSGYSTMFGGSGDDYYVLKDWPDFVVENSNEGNDTISGSLSDISLDDIGNVENLVLTGNLSLNGIGNEDSNVLIGNTGNNRLDGGAGADTMDGGSGDDTYIVDNAGDSISEGVAAGLDAVRSSITHAMGANVERLILTGTGHLDGTGNTQDNLISGNVGDNILDGAAGADIIAGGAGSDTYVIDHSGDQVMELGASGTDSIQSAVSYNLMLAWHVEHLTLTGGSAINGFGNWQHNQITGNSAANSLDGNRGNDTLNGGGGLDSLRGGQGDDTFYFDAHGAPTTDTILDFQSGIDKLLFSQSTFAALGDSGVVAAGRVQIGLSSQINATSGNAGDGLQDVLKYATDTGQLYYDADGSGAGGLSLIATVLSGGSASSFLLPDDILIV